MNIPLDHEISLRDDGDEDAAHNRSSLEEKACLVGNLRAQRHPERRHGRQRCVLGCFA